MRWIPGGRSGDIEDRRDETGGGGGIGGIHVGVGGMIVLFILSLVFKRDFLSLVSGGSSGVGGTTLSQHDTARDSREEPVVQFVSFVLDDNQKTWEQILAAQGVQYRHAKLVLFRDAVQSGCGAAETASGPFYCPEDEKVYIDLGFYDELKQRYGAPGDFAQAYVLAHEIGHHIQTLLGIEQKMREAQRRNPSAANQLSVRLELQADCFAGIWGHSTEQRKILEADDVQEAMNAAAAVGDDRLERQATGHVNPDTFTHGTSQQRMEWFQRGFSSGTISACSTFGQ